jgi:hypothetical protein
MQFAKLAAMTKGWFIGNFSPTLHATMRRCPATSSIP